MVEGAGWVQVVGEWRVERESGRKSGTSISDSNFRCHLKESYTQINTETLSAPLVLYRLNNFLIFMFS